MSLELKFQSRETALEATTAAQSKAADPLSSVWVAANAGTGKTHVLTMRVLRLLLAGTAPERILCLTYTKAAAAEMSKRVFDHLAKWVTADEVALRTDLRGITGSDVADTTLTFARTLFTRAIETPGGLKVQTIHAFAERLLQRFPLEAGVPPDFKILDDAGEHDLLAEAIERVLTQATESPSSPLAKALDTVVRYAADTDFDDLISGAVEERRWLDAAHGSELRKAADEFEAVDAYLRQQLGVRAALAASDLADECAQVLSKDDLQSVRELLQTGSKTDLGHATTLSDAHRDAQRRTTAFGKYFLTGTGELRKDLMTKALTLKSPGLHDRCRSAQQKFFQITQELKALALAEASVALYRISAAVLKHYTAARSASGALDFDDLILKTRALLSGDNGEVQWALYKLDGGLDHILVDEAQDTSPEQWDIVSSLAREFFSDVGAGAAGRTLFAVGDEKQSIYSFQGADPRKFAEAGERFALLAQKAGWQWRSIALTMSFRTVAPVLASVDRVFIDAERTPGLTASGSFSPHAAIRAGQAGLVEIWPTETADPVDHADAWDPLADASEHSPANRLAERIADTIKNWLDTGERLVSEDRPIRPSDIIILVRKRNPFAVPMVAALKRRNIRVAGADRMLLIDQIAAQDLMALGDFLTLPEDDLALATVLKGPIFNFDDDDLLAIAAKREKKTLWAALLGNAGGNAKFKDATETLKRWRAKADFTPPFEFFASVLERDGARDKMLHRLGPEAAEVIDEFLDFALRYDENAPPSLTGFLAQLRETAPEIKRDMDHGRDEVRVMTVHGAKGLEAPIVFLPDTCTTSSGNRVSKALVRLGHLPRPADLAEPIVWAIKGTSGIAAVKAAREIKERREAEERNRLLYVAMTRARDRLYIAGFENKSGRSKGCWYDAIFDALTPGREQVDLGDGRVGWRIEAPQAANHEKPKEDRGSHHEAIARPEFATRRAPAEPKLSVPLAPSRLEPYAPDAEGEPLPPPRRDAAETNDSPSPLSVGGANRFLRGTITHALLQHLPSIAQDRREAIAKAFVESRGGSLPAKVRASIVKETLGVLADPNFAAIFGPQSVAEAPLAAVIPRPSGKGPSLDLSGQIDRLAITDTEVLIVDYKTNRPPPLEVGRVADAYLYQLAAYRLALREIYPGRPIRAALLWTDGPRLMEIPQDVLDRYTARLWDLDLGSLDAS